MGYPPDLTKALVETILRHPLDFEWSIQGLGMLRLYLPGDWRLHVWSTADVTKNVSLLHDHPWSFTSFLVAGRIKNTRYEIIPVRNREDEKYARLACAQTWKRVRILCGPEGGAAGTPDEVWLKKCTPEIYDAMGHGIYSQGAHEIHETTPQDGSVSVIKRVKLADPDHANVFYPVGEQYVTAGGAQEACATEVKRICKNALDRWF